MMQLLVLLVGTALGGASENAEYGHKAVDTAFRNTRLRIYTSTVQWAPNQKHCIEGTEATIVIGKPGREPVWTSFIGAAEDWSSWIDYSKAKNGKLRITHNTFDPRRSRKKNGVPFRLEEIRLDRNGSVVTSDKIVLKKERFDQKRADRLAKEAIEAIKQDAESHSDDSEPAIYRPLGHLRNMGLDHPDAALRIFKTIHRHADGHYGEIVSDFEGEVSLAREVRHK